MKLHADSTQNAITYNRSQQDAHSNSQFMLFLENELGKDTLSQKGQLL